MIVLPEEREELTPEQRAWREYLAHCRGAHPGQYEGTEAQAWQRLCRSVPAVRIAQYTRLLDLDAPPSSRLALPPAPDGTADGTADGG